MPSVRAGIPSVRWQCLIGARALARTKEVVLAFARCQDLSERTSLGGVDCRRFAVNVDTDIDVFATTINRSVVLSSTL